MGDKQIGVKFPAEKIVEIGKAAERKGQTVAGWIRQIVYERLEQEQHREN